MRPMLASALAMMLLLACQAEGAEVTDLVKLLADKDNSKRREAAKELADLGPEAKAALPALRKALRDKDAYVRRFAAQALGKVAVGDLETVKVLFLATNDELENVQEAAINSLAAMGKNATDALLSILKDPNKTPKVRKKAAQGLGAIGPAARSSKTVAALAEVVGGKAKLPKGKMLTDDDIRPDAATALGNIAKPEDAEALTALRSVSEGKQRNRGLQKAAADAVKKITGEAVKKKK